MKTTTTNRLIDEKSPYLLQHAHNPIDWYPWGEEAFNKAKSEDKPVFLSIGYSACHWCHVMADESFDDKEVAEMLNRDFVSVKVDREERPDVDAVYMNVCQALTGRGGWPLTIIMTPEQKPFYAGTYLPKHSKYGMHGLIELLELVSKRWKTDREALVQSGEEIVRILQDDSFDNMEGEDIDVRELIDCTVAAFDRTFDPRYGGFGNAPKFPTPHNLLFLLKYSVSQKDPRALEMTEKTLEGMYRGGIFDHVGYGFSRYSTDEKWLVPHFEKMLYDNALLTIAYLEAYSATGRELYKQVAEKVLQYISREMTSPEGAFYSAQDADSEGEEGKFYLLSALEVETELGSEIGSRFNDRFGLTSQGNFNGLNIPNLIDNDNYEESDLQIDRELPKLVEYRTNRYHLNKDDKILTAWNGLMIAAYAAAYKLTCDIKYLERAEKAIAFVEKHLSDADGTLYVSYRNGQNDTEGFLDDYAFMAWAYLSLYEATFDFNWIEKCIDTMWLISEKFEDDEDGGCYLYSHSGEALITRPKETYDGALPSGNAVVGYVLSRLSMITGNPELTGFAERQLSFLGRKAEGHPVGHAFSLIAVMPKAYQHSQLICVLPDSEKAVEIRKALNRRYLPNVVVLIKTPRNEKLLSQIAPYTHDQNAVEGKSTFYVCRDYTCSAPTHSFEQALNKTVDN